MKFGLITLLFTILAVPSIGLGSNLGFLQDAPIAKMDAADTELLAASIQRALNGIQNGEALHWRNDKTGSHGTVKPLRTYPAHNTTCRTLSIVNAAQGETAASKFEFCLNPEGVWKVLK